MKKARDYLSGFRVMAEELGKIPEYHEEAERLYRQLRGRGVRQVPIGRLERTVRRGRRLKELAAAG